MRHLAILAASLLALGVAAGAGTAAAQPASQAQTGMAGPGPWWGWSGGPGMMTMGWGDPRMLGWGAGPMNMGGWPGHHGQMMRGSGRMTGGPAQHLDGRIAFLRAELKITEAQAPLFDAYAQVLRDAAEGMQAMHDRMWSRDPPEAMPERLQVHIDAMTQRLEALQKLKAALVPLYDALSGDQKDTADSLLSPMGMM